MQSYQTLYGDRVALRELSARERRTFDRLRRYASRRPDWNDFCNWAWRQLQECYAPQKLLPRQITRRSLYRIAQDLEARLGIAQGKVAEPDYGDALLDLIEQSRMTGTNRSKTTGISRELLSHVLHGRKDLSLTNLKKLLDALGYRITFTRKPSGLGVEDAVIDEPRRLPARRNGAVRRVRRRASA